MVDLSLAIYQIQILIKYITTPPLGKNWVPKEVGYIVVSEGHGTVLLVSKRDQCMAVPEPFRKNTCLKFVRDLLSIFFLFGKTVDERRLVHFNSV